MRFNLRATNLAPGRYRLAVFARSVVENGFTLSRVADVTVRSTTVMTVDTPSAGSAVRPFAVAGWALDRSASIDTGVDAVHVYAYPDSGAPIFLGAAPYGGVRPDVAAVFGAQFARSGFRLVVTTLPPGRYRIVVFARTIAHGAFATVQVVAVTVS